jgi:uncharacterized beta-barrel protein YwiB (DUF1934 family)
VIFEKKIKFQVEAKDRDTFENFGDICEYFIRTSDMPFEINKKGVISLTQPLGANAPDTYVFTVMAKDCGGRISEEATTVNIIVDKDCSPGNVEIRFHFSMSQARVRKLNTRIQEQYYNKRRKEE